jgi:hypothetical protein
MRPHRHRGPPGFRAEEALAKRCWARSRSRHFDGVAECDEAGDAALNLLALLAACRASDQVQTDGVGGAHFELIVQMKQ